MGAKFSKWKHDHPTQFWLYIILILLLIPTVAMFIGFIIIVIIVIMLKLLRKPEPEVVPEAEVVAEADVVAEAAAKVWYPAEVRSELEGLLRNNIRILHDNKRQSDDIQYHVIESVIAQIKNKCETSFRYEEMYPTDDVEWIAKVCLNFYKYKNQFDRITKGDNVDQFRDDIIQDIWALIPRPQM